MKPSILAGIAMIAIGAFLYLRGGSFTTREDVIKVGDLKVSAEEKHSLSPWIAGIAVVGGIVLIAAGARSRA